MSASHSWETRGQKRHHDWDVTSEEEEEESDKFGDCFEEVDWDAEDENLIDWDAAGPQASGDELAQQLLSLLNRGMLSAKHVCILSFFASKAGAQGFVCNLAKKPDSPSGHFQRHLDKELGWKDEVKDLYCLEAPGHNRYDKDRVVHKLDSIPVHELIAEEVSENPSLIDKLTNLVTKREWTIDYYENPIVTGHPDEPVFPLGLYADFVNHSKIDAVCGITIQNLVSGTRHLSISLKRSLLCRCGCFGADSS